ncbi:MAG: hypothetical protein KA715_10965 [Xanthomonadaceae bacterium]|nr:hypothetical protein [Xanthomonadaceae bacterium]
MKQIADPNKLLFQLAESQRGLFTASQAHELGFVPNNHAYHVKQGHWTKVERGIYRYNLFPYDPEESLVQHSLWSRNREGKPQGVFSHETALKYYELSDLDSKKIHMTVSKDFRRTSKTPKILTLHFSDLSKDDIKQSRGFSVTTPLKTIRDIIEIKTISFDFIEQAIRESLTQGLIRKAELQNLISHLQIDADLKKDLEKILKGKNK